MTTSTCHPERPARRNGLCNTCSVRAWHEANPGRRSKKRRPALCHPDRPGRGFGLCGACYDREVRPEAVQRHRRARALRPYGLTIEAYGALLVAQDGLCAICHRPPIRGNLHVDHDHATGRVRGLLCHLCNRALGALRDDPKLAIAAAEYLRR